MKHPLSIRIMDFLKKYTKPAANWDGEDEDGKYNGPDPYHLEVAAQLIDQGKKPDWVNSEWGSGCYGRYSDRKGRDEHDNILEAIKNFKL